MTAVRLGASMIRSVRTALAQGAAAGDQMQLENLRRLRLGAVLFMPVVALAALWVLDGPGQGQQPLERWRLVVGWTHVVSACACLVFALLAHLALRHAPQGRRARALLWAAAGFTLLAGLVLTLAYQWVAPKLTPLATTTIVIAVVFHLAPRVTTVLYLSTAVLGFVALPGFQSDAELLMSGRVSMIVLPLMALAVAIVNWRTYSLTIVLGRSLSQANSQLLAKQQLLEQLAWFDGLTGLCRRDEFMRRADHELQRAARYEHPTALVLVDIDHFKEVNDTWGHPVGDAVLRHMAQVLQSQLRTSDLLARLGGEEFVVMLPNTSQRSAQACAENLRRAVEQTPLVPNRDTPAIHVTISLGVLEVPASAAVGIQTAYAAVDRALYEAKTGGRNRIVLGSLSEGIASSAVTPEPES